MNHAFLPYVVRAISLVFLLTVGVAAQHTILWDNLRLDLRPSSLTSDDWHDLVVDSSGEYRVFWTQQDVGGVKKNIIMRRFSPQGVPVGTETTVRSVPASAICEIIGSGYGTWAVLWIEKNLSDTVLYMQRFGADGVLRDAQPFRVASIDDAKYYSLDGRAIIDHNEYVLVVVPELNSDYSNNRQRVFYYNRSGIADSITIKFGDSWFREVVPQSESRAIFLFEDRYYLVKGGARYRIYSQVYSYATNRLSAVSEKRVIEEGIGPDLFSYDVSAIGSCDYPGVAMTFWDPVYNQLAFKLLDGDGVDQGQRRILQYNYDDARMIAGFGGAYMIVACRSDGTQYYYDAIVASSRDASPGAPVVVGSGDRLGNANKSFGLDAAQRIFFGRSHQKSVYLRRLGANELPKHRVNGLDESPLRGSVAISAGGAYRYCAWITATADSICINGRMSPTGNKYETADAINWYTSVPASGSTAEFGLAARADTVALAWIRSEGATQASVRLGIWKTLDNTNLNLSTLTEGGVLAQKASVAFGGDRCAVVWEQKSPLHGDTSWVYVQTMKTDGSGRAAAVALSPGSSPHICALNDGSFLVTFQYVRNVSTTVGGIPITRTVSNVFGVFIAAATGQPYTDIFRLNSRPDNAYEPRGVYLSGGQTLAFWKEVGVNMSTAKVFAVRIAAAGSVTGEEFRCVPLDSTVNTYDVSAAGDSLVLLVWHSLTGNLVSRQYVVAHNGALSPVETVSEAAANPDVPVTVSVSASDSSALIGWLSGSHFGRNHRMFLADYIVREQMTATSIYRTSPQQRTARVPVPVHRYSQDCFSLSGRRIKSGYADNRQTGVYLVRQPDGTLRRQIQIRGNRQR